MGAGDSKINFRSAVARLAEDTPLTDDDSFWSEFWKYDTSVDDIFALAPSEDVRRIRDQSPDNLALLCHKLIGKIKSVTDCGLGEVVENHIAVLNCIRVLTRILPFLFEVAEGGALARQIFWTLRGPKSYLAVHERKPSLQSGPQGEQKPPGAEEENSTIPQGAMYPGRMNDKRPEEKFGDELEEYLGVTLLNSLADLCFMPHFTITADILHLNLKTLDSREFIWVPGVGSEKPQDSSSNIESNRKEVLKLLLTCFSQTLYISSPNYCKESNPWLEYFSSSDCKIRHLLPLFCSLLNTVFSYDPVGLGLPYQFYMFSDDKEPLVEVCLTLLIVLLDFQFPDVNGQVPVQRPSVPGGNLKTVVDPRTPPGSGGGTPTEPRVSAPDVSSSSPPSGRNIFINYLSRLHRVEDFQFIENGIKILLNNPLTGSYLPGSQKKITCYQELMLFFWQFCLYNKSFLYHMLRSSEVLEIVIPILHYLVHSRKNAALLGLMHIGVFIILVLSGERSFGVRLNTAFKQKYSFDDLPLFTGSHVDLLILCFHKIITNGSEHLFSLYDCMLTVLVNISPYIKSLSMISGSKITHLFEVFSNPRFLLSSRGNHHFIFFLLEFCNNIIQYQFDGNANFIYMIIRNRTPFEKLAVMPSDPIEILNKVGTKGAQKQAEMIAENAMRSMSLGGGSNANEGADESERAVSVGGQNGVNVAPVSGNRPVAAQAGNPLNGNKTDGVSAVSKPGLDDRIPSNVPVKSPIFVPTTEWVQGWKEKLPLQTVLRLLQVLVPQVEQLCIEKEISDDTEIIEFLKHGTLVGLLPVPHPILIRKYQSHPGTDKWLTSYLWGVVFLRHFNPPVWYGTNIRLFQIRSAPPT